MDPTATNVASFGTAALLKDIQQHPGFAGLKPRYRETLLVFARLADPETLVVSGDREEISRQLGLRRPRRLYDHVAAWSKRGLVAKTQANHTNYEIDPETRRATYRRGSCWQLLPVSEAKTATSACAELAPRAEAAPEAAPRVLPGQDVFGPEQGTAALKHEAESRISWLEQAFGEQILGRSRAALYAALVENQRGVQACYDEAQARGKDPLRLFLRMVNDGDWRKKGSPPEASSIDDLFT